MNEKQLGREQREQVEPKVGRVLESPVEHDASRETMSEILALKVSLCGKSNLNEVAIKVQDVRVKCVVDSGADITSSKLAARMFRRTSGVNSIKKCVRTSHRSRRADPAHGIGGFRNNGR